MSALLALRAAAPEDLLSAMGLFILLWSAWSGDRAARAITGLAVLSLGGAAALALPALCHGLVGAQASAFGGMYSSDAFAAFAKLLIYGAAIAALLIAPAFFERLGAMRAEYPLLVLFAALGMGLMVSATDLVTLYVGLELNSLAAYVLAAFYRADSRSAEAGLKYFVLGALASGILLFGMSLTYGFAGGTGFSAIRASLAGPMGMGASFGMVFILAGMAFKVSAAPFHMWTPDVYEGSPTPVTMFFATAPKVAALGLTMRLALFAFGTQTLAWQQIVMALALLSIVIGALGAIGQGNIKRLLAYSSINNVGFMLVGLAAATPAGAAAMLTYLAIYVVTSVAGFVAVLMLKDENGAPVEAIADLAGLSSQRKVLSACLAMVMFSLAGIPPLFGFWGKFVVFQAAVAAGQVVLATVAVAASVISAFYYLKVVKVLYFDEPAGKALGRSDWVHQALLLAAALAISPLGYLATRALAGWTQAAAAALFHAA